MQTTASVHRLPTRGLDPDPLEIRTLIALVAWLALRKSLRRNCRPPAIIAHGAQAAGIVSAGSEEFARVRPRYHARTGTGGDLTSRQCGASA